MRETSVRALHVILTKPADEDRGGIHAPARQRSAVSFQSPHGWASFLVGNRVYLDAPPRSGRSSRRLGRAVSRNGLKHHRLRVVTAFNRPIPNLGVFDLLQGKQYLQQRGDGPPTALSTRARYDSFVARSSSRVRRINCWQRPGPVGKGSVAVVAATL